MTAPALPREPVAPSPAPRAAVTTLPRHRARSSALLVVLAVTVGVLVAATIGTLLVLVAVALRSTVTS